MVLLNLIVCFLGPSLTDTPLHPLSFYIWYRHLSVVTTCQGLALSDQISNFLTFRSDVLNQGLIKNPLYPPASVSDGAPVMRAA